MWLRNGLRLKVQNLVLYYKHCSKFDPVDFCFEVVGLNAVAVRAARFRVEGSRYVEVDSEKDRGFFGHSPGAKESFIPLDPKP